MCTEPRPPSIWFMPWNWGREELRRLVVWGAVICLILSSVAPRVLPWIATAIGHFCWLGWMALFREIEKLV